LSHAIAKRTVEVTLRLTGGETLGGLVFLDYDLDGHEDLYVSAGALDILNWVQPNPLFRNRSGGKFALLEERSGAFLYNSSRTVVRGDYDRDGDEDLLVCNMGDRPYLYRNEKVGGTFLALTLQGTASNRDGIGARVKVSAAGLPDQYRLAQSGSTTGGSHDHALVFGLAGRGTADLVTVSWPSGNQTVLSAVPANQFLTVVE